jgi:cellulose synthase/poly-beta-1,6-N-acetylglucosamine synthase-like glycosyltransferase
VTEIFVIDDGSTDGSGKLAGVPVIRSDINAGRGAARAKAMNRANSELVLGCDATLTLDTHFLEYALPWFRNDQVVAVFGWVRDDSVCTVANRWRRRHLFKSHLERQVTHFASFCTGCSLVRKSVVQQVGGFNAGLRVGEDADLGQRLLRAGFDVVLDPRLFATTDAKNSVMEVLERYARWNPLDHVSLQEYALLVRYVVRRMVVMDLKAKGPLGAGISLLAPHYQLWWRILAKDR